MYNEASVVGTVIEGLREDFPHVVCVDDGSTDGSQDVARQAGAVVVQHPVNLGQGAALQTGIEYALQDPELDCIVTFDADGQHLVDDVERMVGIARQGEADVVLGSRFADGGEGVPRLKRFVLRTAVLLSSSSRRLRLTDAHNGLRVLTRPVVQRLNITMNGMAHASEIVDFLGRGDWRVKEVPVTIRYTEYSMSKGQSLINAINILFDLSIRHRHD